MFDVCNVRSIYSFLIRSVIPLYSLMGPCVPCTSSFQSLIITGGPPLAFLFKKVHIYWMTVSGLSGSTCKCLSFLLLSKRDEHSLLINRGVIPVLGGQMVGEWTT